MNPVIVRNVIIGEGIPKICVPIVGASEEEIARGTGLIRTVPADVAEWRADWYEDAGETKKVIGVLASMRDLLGDIPILFTFRTVKEGGRGRITAEGYAELAGAVIEQGFADMIDVELSAGEGLIREITARARRRGVKVIISSHDFEKTPPKEEIVEKFRRMQQLGADIPKIAVMPQNRKDVLTLLAASEEMSRVYAEGPIIAMSMGHDGVISRLCGEVFGSSLTFGAAGKVSAPGQTEVKDLKAVLNLLHDAGEKE